MFLTDNASRHKLRSYKDVGKRLWDPGTSELFEGRRVTTLPAHGGHPAGAYGTEDDRRNSHAKQVSGSTSEPTDFRKVRAGL